MQKIAQLSGRDLEWTQPSGWKRSYELRSGDALLGTLKFRSMFGSFATAESGEGTWTFKRMGFWQKKSSIQVSGTDTEVAVFKHNLWKGGGMLEFPTGRKIKACTNLLLTRLDFKADSSEPLVRFHCGGFLHRRAEVKISPQARQNPEVPLCVFLGWWVIILQDADTATASSAAASG